MKKMLVLFLLQFGLLAKGIAQCTPENDSLALVALFNATGGPDWLTKTNWLVPGQPISSWAKVTANQAGCVTELYLSNNNLTGSLPDELGNLTELEVLNVSSNNLSGTIPLSITTLPKLYNMWLSVNNLSGPIPPELGNMGSLRYLLLDWNNFSGQIPPELGNLSLLLNMYLTSNQLSGPIPPELGDLSEIQYLFLGLNELEGSIPEELGNCTNLVWLAMQQNQLEGCIPSSLQSLCNATVNLQDNPKLPWGGDFDLFCAEVPQLGAPCNDGDPGTMYGEIQPDCSCLGFNGSWILGTAEKSGDADCLSDDPVAPLRQTLIRADSDFPRYTTTDALMGDYQFILPPGTYVLSPQPALPFLWDTCSQLVDLANLGDTVLVDFNLPALDECPFITVELAVPVLERCFAQDIYIHYCNYGTVAADSAALFLELDDDLTLANPPQAWSWVSPDDPGLSCVPQGVSSSMWYLPVGPLEMGECQQISVPVQVECSAEPGETHCIRAFTCPDDACVLPPSWSGADMRAEATCTGDSVTLLLKNIGNAQSQLLDFIVIEDDVVLMHGAEVYEPDGIRMYTMPSNGQYFRIQSAQEPGHPFPAPVMAWEVGCNGSALPGTNWINHFAVASGYASESTACRENIGSYDPNDKQGFPLGYGNDHLIERGVELEYLIRFQNTGTAPAKDVIIRDTLSPYLDPGTLRMGAGSHLFTWTLHAERVLTISFNNINLPDSLTNPEGSQGFINYRIAQQASLPSGTDIFNKAAIYFDFNPPIITNETRHRIGENFLSSPVSTREVEQLSIVLASPNPARDLAWVTAPTASALKMYDLFGQLQLSTNSENESGHFLIPREGLPSGVYTFILYDHVGKPLYKGKLVFL